MAATVGGPSSAFESPTFDQDVSIAVDDDIGAASISPAGRDIVLASKSGLRIIDLDSPWSLPLFIPNQSSWDVADVQWSPFAARAEWIASTRNQLALVYNLSMPYNNKKAPIEYTLRAHDRAITDINFSAHHPDLLATCGVDSFVFVHDLRSRQTPLRLADFTAGATQVKWNRQSDKIIASAHDKYLHIWDIRRGATPLSTIAAHSTKIYGIDWNRNDPKKILTCSLDATIKLWNDVGVSANVTAPRRVIRTQYPVWRARHTPFPHGILAMPQRGNSNLWLYKHVNDSDISTFTNSPIHAFQGHEQDAQVREFLWRARGSTDDGIDNRDFQLVSWGTDKHLHLHRLSPDLLGNTVGYRKGDALLEQPSGTRKGATYVSYRDGPIPTTTATTRDEFGPPRQQRKGNLSTLLQNSTLNEQAFPSRLHGETQPRMHSETLPRETMTAQPIRSNDPRVVTHITWLDGIKFGDRHNESDLHAPSTQHDQAEKHPYQEQNDLGAEISHVGNKYKKLTFEQIDVPGRCIKVAFQGPWGEYDATANDHKLVFLRFTIRFPKGYPKATESTQSGTLPSRAPTPLNIDFERTTASISRENQEDLAENMNYIASTCAEQQREALEAVLSYALGERGLDDSLNLAGDNQSLEDLEPLSGESSSEDDEQEGEFTNDVMQSSHTNANTPVPIQCSARFSSTGSLVVARIPSTKSAPGSEALRFQITRSLRNGAAKNDIFNSFGRFTTHRADESDGASSPSSSVGSWETSSPSSSSGSDHAANPHIGNFQPPLAWQKAASRFQSRDSLPSSIGAGKQSSKPRSTVSILSSAIDTMMPSKRVLAEEYWIFGPGSVVCEHNSEVARRHGFEELADIWMLCKLILSNEIPLQILPQQYRRDQILVVARRALVRIKRKDSGLDLQFDEADTVINPRLKGRTKWGNSPVATWLIPALFDHFERLADTQMLAMLSCIFAEPATREGVTSIMAKMRQSQLPMSMEAPAFSLDYFSSEDTAWSLFNPTIAVPPTSSHSQFATPVTEFGVAKNLDTYGSHGSSNGPWGSDTVDSDPVTPFSTGNTPPGYSRASTVRSARTAVHTPYSTSPEQSYHGIKRSSAANFASAVAALSRPFANAISSSPPIKSRMDDLSTSAPTSGVTWGTTTFYGSKSQDRNSLAPSSSKHGKRASFGQTERINVNYIDDSDSDYERVNVDGGYVYGGTSKYDVPGPPLENEVDESPGPFRVTLKNQDQFDDEACVSKPLLDMSKDWLYRAWREQYAEMLSRWGLISNRAEVLKFNGLVSYFPPEVPRTGPKSGSVCLTLRKEEDEDGNGDEGKAKHRSRASTTLVPPFFAMGQGKHSPGTSPRRFSFNPEAREFQPGTRPNIPSEEFASQSDAFTPNEQYLRLSIPASKPSRELDENLADFGTSPGRTKLQPPPSRSSRPSLSRGTSNISGASSWRDGRSRTTIPDSSASRAAKSEPIYSCSICWIRVSGRFYLCPACGHVAHFDCMDDELCMDESECIVGCGCGCGLEDDDERTRMEAYIDEVRAANAAGVAWNEGGEWLQLASQDRPETPGIYTGIMHGDFMTGAASKMAASPEERREKSLDRSTVVSQTPGKSKKKGKKKVRASGLSYY